MRKALNLFDSPPPPPPLALGEADSGPVHDLDDYDDGPHLHLVDPPRPAPTIIVESVGENFEVSRLRDNGSTVACVMWTRAELEELRRRIDAALEMR